MIVFVYGSLKRGFRNYPVMEAADGVFLRNAITIPEYDLVNLGAFPGMIRGEYSVAGEVFQVRDIAPLDRLEGHPHFYTRIRITVKKIEPEPFQDAEWDVWGYLFNNEQHSNRGGHDGLFNGDDRVLVNGNVKEWV